MPEQKKRIVVDGVEFSQLFQFPRILAAAAAALQPARLAIGVLMVTALVTFGQIWDGMATRTGERGTFQTVAADVVRSVNQIVESVFAPNAKQVIDGLHHLLIQTPVSLWEEAKGFALVYGLFALAVLAVGGGAISRIAACQIADHERLGAREALEFALRRMGRLMMAQAWPLVIMLGLGLVVMLMGALLAAPVVDVAGGLLYGLGLALGFLIAFMLIAYAAGFPMLIPAVGCESCGGFDAMQRAYAHTITRPLHLVGYWIVGLVGLAVGFGLVNLVAMLTLNMTAALYGVLAGDTGMPAAGGYGVWALMHESTTTAAASATSWHGRWSASLVGFWETVVLCLVAAYALAYHFSAATVLYLVMRRACEGQAINEIWRPGLVEGTQAAVPEAAVPEEAKVGREAASDEA